MTELDIIKEVARLQTRIAKLESDTAWLWKTVKGQQVLIEELKGK